MKRRGSQSSSPMGPEIPKLYGFTGKDTASSGRSPPPPPAPAPRMAWTGAGMCAQSRNADSVCVQWTRDGARVHAGPGWRESCIPHQPDPRVRALWVRPPPITPVELAGNPANPYPLGHPFPAMRPAGDVHQEVVSGTQDTVQMCAAWPREPRTDAAVIVARPDARSGVPVHQGRSARSLGCTHRRFSRATGDLNHQRDCHSSGQRSPRPRRASPEAARSPQTCAGSFGVKQFLLLLRWQ